MAVIRKRGKSWQAYIRRKGFSQSRTFNSKSAAQKWAYEIEHNIVSGRDSIVRGKTLADALDRYGKDITPRKKSAINEHRRIKRLKNNGFCFIDLEELRPDHLQEWIDTELQRVKSSSVNRDISLLSSVLRVCRQRWRWMQHNPLEAVDKPKEPLPRTRRISDDDVKLILDALGYDEAAKHDNTRQALGVAFQFAIETAMRQGEIYSMLWRDVDIEKKTVYLPETKNGKPREVPLSTFAIELLRRMKNIHKQSVFPFNQASSATIFRRAVQMAEVRGLTFHDTRHEATTRLSKHLSVLELAKTTGHTDPRSLMVFTIPQRVSLLKSWIRIDQPVRVSCQDQHC